MSNQKSPFKLTLPNIVSIESIEQFIEHATDYLLTHLLQIGSAHYLLTEFEFYIKPKDVNETSFHNDVYTHGHSAQLTSGRFYFHGSGVDITCGNDKYFGGILLRGLAKIDINTASAQSLKRIELENIEKIIHGPLKVASELLCNLEFGKNNRIDFLQTNLQNTNPYGFVHISKSGRYGLSKNIDTTDNYFDKAYRIIGHFPSKIFNLKKDINVSIHHKERILVNEFKTNIIDSLGKLKEILGYQPKI